MAAKQSKLLVLGLCIDVFDADITNFNLAIIGVDIDRLTCQLTVHNVVFMEDLQTFEDLTAPALDHFEPRLQDLLQVFPDRASGD